MAAFDTVAKVIAYSRVLLQDQVNSPFRYPDADLLVALSSAFPEMQKLRPDLFLSFPPPQPEFLAVDNTAITIDPMYRIALCYYVVGQAQIRDDEEVQDQRAAAFLQMFVAKLGKLE